MQSKVARKLLTESLHSCLRGVAEQHGVTTYAVYLQWLSDAKWNMSVLSSKLGISKTTLHRLTKSLNVDVPHANDRVKVQAYLEQKAPEQYMQGMLEKHLGYENVARLISVQPRSLRKVMAEHGVCYSHASYLRAEGSRFLLSPIEVAARYGVPFEEALAHCKGHGKHIADYLSEKIGVMLYSETLFASLVCPVSVWYSVVPPGGRSLSGALHGIMSTSSGHLALKGFPGDASREDIGHIYAHLEDVHGTQAV